MKNLINKTITLLLFTLVIIFALAASFSVTARPLTRNQMRVIVKKMVDGLLLNENSIEITKYELKFYKEQIVYDIINHNMSNWEYIVNKLYEYQLPMEILFLSMIESKLNNAATSKANAKGVWQFIPGTAERYGIKGKEGDLEYSTQAAIRYLTKLYHQFKDWKLAFAAYNCGENRIKAELDKVENKTFEGIKDKLPQETREYVPKILALSNVVRKLDIYRYE